jgi:mRNA-degrading endonuclease RelE of RelBE toxin-antitoxin system
MPFRVTLTSGADEDLAYYRTREQRLIVDAAKRFLTHDADRESKRRKKLRPNPLAPWELCVDRFRVFYEVVDAATVKVVAIGHKEHNDLLIRGKVVSL